MCGDLPQANQHGCLLINLERNILKHQNLSGVSHDETEAPNTVITLKLDGGFTFV